jgi:hypothetical protein
MSECICEGNWRDLVRQYEPLIGRRYRDRHHDNKEYVFFGLVHGERDYYFGMWTKDDCRLLSCVGDPEGYGLELVDSDG